MHLLGISVPWRYQYAPLGTKVYLLKRYRPSDSFRTFFSESVYLYNSCDICISQTSTHALNTQTDILRSVVHMLSPTMVVWRRGHYVSRRHAWHGASYLFSLLATKVITKHPIMVAVGLHFNEPLYERPASQRACLTQARGPDP